MDGYFWRIVGFAKRKSLECRKFCYIFVDFFRKLRII